MTGIDEFGDPLSGHACSSEILTGLVGAPHWISFLSIVVFFGLSVIWKIIRRKITRACCTAAPNADGDGAALLPNAVAPPGGAPAASPAAVAAADVAYAVVTVRDNSAPPPPPFVESWSDFILQIDVEFIALQFLYHIAHFIYITRTIPAALDHASSYHRYGYVYARWINSGFVTWLGATLSNRHLIARPPPDLAALQAENNKPNARQPQLQQLVIDPPMPVSFDSQTVRFCCGCYTISSEKMLRFLLLAANLMLMPATLTHIIPMLFGPYIWLLLFSCLRRRHLNRARRGECCGSAGFIIVRLLYSLYYAFIVPLTFVYGVLWFSGGSACTYGEIIVSEWNFRASTGAYFNSIKDESYQLVSLLSFF